MLSIRSLSVVIILTCFCLAASMKSFSQIVQQVRGTVRDATIQTPVAGATVTLISLNQRCVTGEDGSFRFKSVPVGLHQISVTHVGYSDILLENVRVIAGKESVLNISLEILVEAEKEVVVLGESAKGRPLNEMSHLSARAFSVEETQRYAASVNDPLRMAISYAGVMSADDGNNNIVIRGNSPAGLLWRMEGVDIPNPNHFADAGNSGGGVSILSSQLLSNSDFLTGAFAAEYGNALSGVFDLRLRKGNDEKKEYAFQAGVLGLNLAAEGPFSKPGKGSYLANYRYSTLNLLDKLGVNIAGGSVDFQDFSFNVHVPTKNAGEFSLFGLGGLSSQHVVPGEGGEDDNFSSYFRSNTGIIGLTHVIYPGSSTSVKTVLAYSATDNQFDEDIIKEDDQIRKTWKENYLTNKVTVSSTLNHKFSNRSHIRVGTIGNFISFNYLQHSRPDPEGDLKETINSTGNTQSLQAFAQWQFRPSNTFILTGGLHYLHLMFNNTHALEPRFALKWSGISNHSFALGYGLHSQIQPLGAYFAKEEISGETIMVNKNLDLTRAHHLVFSHTYRISTGMKLKTELYYQQLDRVPVGAELNSTFSTLNTQGDYIAFPLVNQGTGKNYGLEISLERQLRDGYYFLVNSSIYQSKYKSQDKVERNTRFNGNHINNFTAGKEFEIKGKNKSIGTNIKVIYAGGYRTTPIDVPESEARGYTVYKENLAWSLKNPDYFRADVGLNIKWNRKKHTHTVSLDIQNITNRLNVYGQIYDVKRGLSYTYQTGLIPVLNYKIEF
ncbi:MAG TPA: TonB-dependent receptor [Parasegetibacter sp.]